VSNVTIGRAVTVRAPSSSASVNSEDPAAECTSIVVEVGGDRGALVLYLDDAFRNHEVEISPVGSAHRVHTGVLDRATAAGTALAAVFGSLAAGPYLVWRDNQTAAATVVVIAGQVTEWRSHRR
jgi:hypothetical protein